MTKEDAQKLKRFDHLCTCGGYAFSVNGRNPARPHRSWCPQRPQYNEWYDALNGTVDKGETQA